MEKTAPPKEALQGIKDTVHQTDINAEENQDEAEEKNTQHNYDSRHMNDSIGFLRNELDTSTCKPEEQKTHLINQQPGCSFQRLLDSDVKVCIIRTGNTNCDKDFTDMLQSRIENMTEVGSVGESDIILVFCPVVSRAGTDIDKALERFNHNTETKLAVLVVLHRTFDPEKTVPDSSRSIKRTDILTVDCLFNEDTGLLKCQKNSDAADKVVNWLIQQGSQRGVKICLHKINFTNPGQIQYPEHERCKLNKKGSSRTLNLKMPKMGNNDHSRKKVKVFSIFPEKIKNCQKEFFNILRNRFENMKEGRTRDKSDVILVFCPVVSRAGTDIDAALNSLTYPTDSKLTVLVVLHHTFDPEKTVPDSSRSIKRTDILTVDCLFYEDTGLLKCQKNSDAADKTVNWLIQQGAKIGIKISPCQHKSSSFTSLTPAWPRVVGHQKQKSKVQEMAHNSSRPVEKKWGSNFCSRMLDKK